MNRATEAPAPAPPTLAPPGRRLLALDALRGFDMFWIVGGEELVRAAANAWPVAPLRAVERQMGHSAWEGFTFYDLIFPLFLFIAGVSLVFALTRIVERDGRGGAVKHVLVRALTLYLLGLFFYGGLSGGLDHVRWVGVLQRIAVCYLAAGVLFCFVPTRGLVTLTAALLAGYWALTTFVPVRDFNLERDHLQRLGLDPDRAEAAARFEATDRWVSGRFEDGRNLPQHVDFQYLPGHRWDGASDPEGILSTLPAVATCLFGVLAGVLLRKEGVAGRRKVWALLAAGLGCLVLGLLWAPQFPIIKRIWTSSYALVAAGFSYLLLAAFFQVIEVWQWRAWCVPFLWIGMNPITLYLAFNLIPFNEFADRLVGGPVQASLGPWGPVLHAGTVLAMVLALARFLFANKIFLRL